MRLLLILPLSLLLLASGCAEKFNTADYIQLNKNYDVVIERDYLGVPHIIGERDVDAAFGFAYAQAEDNWQIIHDSIPFYRGTNAAINGREAATIDFLIHWLGIWEDLDAGYETQLKPETRAYIEAFADGINYYAALHPEETNQSLFPINGKDIVAGYMLRHLLFYGLMHQLLSYLKSSASTLSAAVENPLPKPSSIAAAMALPWVACRLAPTL